MKAYLLSLVFCFVATVLAAQSVSIFNGKDLSGWTVHGTERWYVEGGELICESGPEKQYGYLSTNKPYKNFDFSVRFKGQHTGGIYESYGREWLIKPEAEDEKHLRTGRWNKLRIRVVNDEVTTWLNGHQMITLKDETIGKGEGFIALQIHDGGGIKVRWKKFRVKELP
jgi:hypothetical protein